MNALLLRQHFTDRRNRLLLIPDNVDIVEIQPECEERLEIRNAVEQSIVTHLIHLLTAAESNQLFGSVFPWRLQGDGDIVQSFPIFFHFLSHKRVAIQIR